MNPYVELFSQALRTPPRLVSWVPAPPVVLDFVQGVSCCERGLEPPNLTLGVGYNKTGFWIVRCKLRRAQEQLLVAIMTMADQNASGNHQSQDLVTINEVVNSGPGKTLLL